MTDQSHRTAAIGDARALLGLMLDHGWQQAHVVSGGTEIFVARARGAANPMRNLPTTTAADARSAPREIVVSTPHVATLASVASVGAFVTEGGVVATIEVLGAEEDLVAPCSGQVLSVMAQPGTLLEFGTPVLTIGDGLTA